MDVLKLRLKLGVHEFEAEGSQDVVEKHLGIFLEKIEASQPQGGGQHPAAAMPATASTDAKSVGAGNGKPATASNGNQTPASSNLPISLPDLQKIANLNGDVVTLSALPAGDTAEEDALVLLLLAHKVMRSVDQVHTDDLLAGMKQSGIDVERLDRIFKKIEGSHAIRTGVKRGTKYRLTVPGVLRAKTVAETLLQTVG